MSISSERSPLSVQEIEETYTAAPLALQGSGRRGSRARAGPTGRREPGRRPSTAREPPSTTPGHDGRWRPTTTR